MEPRTPPQPPPPPQTPPYISGESKQKITHLLSQVEGLSGVEKLLLYLQLPTGPQRPDPLKQPLNPLGSRSEIHQTVMWIQTHLEVDPEISLPKQDVYDEYLEYCRTTKMKPLSTADFGKVMKQVYPCVKPRRLGTRGNSRYCYAGMRKRIKLEVPQLPDLGEKEKTIAIPTVQNDLLIAASLLIREWAEVLLGLKFENLCELAQHLIDKNYVDTSSMAATMLMSKMVDSVKTQVADDKSQSKIHERGVIKQLKRKIQCQPNVKRMENENVIINEGPSGHIPNVLNIKDNPDFSIKMENVGSPVDYVSPRRNELSRSSDQMSPDIPGNTRHFSQLPPEHYLSNENEAVNLASSYLRTQYPSQEYMRLYKNSSLPLRHSEYDSIRYNSYYSESSTQPHNLCINSYSNNPNPAPIHEHRPEYFSLNSNLPINLSSNMSEESESKVLKNIHEKSFPTAANIKISAPQDSDSLNLSLATKKSWTSQTSNLPHSSPSRLPLPGKKMILEAYNNEIQINSPQSVDSNLNVKPTVSPGKFAEALSRGEYLPKKMRATESFSGKLPPSRIQSNPSAEVFNKECEKSLKEEPAPNPPAGQQSQNFVGNMNLDLSINQNPTFQSSTSVMQSESSEKFPPKEFNSSTNPDIPNLIPFRKLGTDFRETKKTHRSPRKKSNLQSPDITNNNVIQMNVPKPRGRPRKKSPTKAKYTKRQRKANISPACTSKGSYKVDVSTEISNSAPECVQLKNENTCEEKPTDILTRERVISICNMDKHALDDYLIEGNSQENEEELMKYFQPNSDSLSNDGIPKLADEKTHVEVEKVEKVLSSIRSETTKFHNSSRGNDFLESNADSQEDHSQSKNDKLTQIRELLESSLTHNTSTSSSQEVDNNLKHSTLIGTGHILGTTADGSESAFTSVTRRDSCSESHNKEGSASSTLAILSQKQQSKGSSDCDLANTILSNRTLNARRRVSFENHSLANNGPINRQITSDSAGFLKNLTNVPQSPTSRLQQFNFMPISPGPPSPNNVNKDSPLNQFKSNISPVKSILPSCINTSPTNQNAQINSPFVSPRNTPIPRTRNSSNSQLKPTPNRLQSKRLSKNLNNKLANKCLGLRNSSQCSLLHKKTSELNNFAIPVDQTQTTTTTMIRSFPMSAPPSPNILAGKYKPNFTNHNAVKYGEVNAPIYAANKICMPRFSNSFDSARIQAHDSLPGDTQPHSADPLSHEVSQFFPENMELGNDLPLSSIRSQSVPLNQSMIVSNDINQVFFNNARLQNTPMNSGNFLSYNNTPCNSVPPTPIPREFCDFGTLNDTCESISKAGLDSENLDKIYNVLDSSVQNSLSNESCDTALLQPMNIVKENDGILNQVDNATLGLNNYSRPLSLDPSIKESLQFADIELDRILPSSDSIVKHGNYQSIDSVFSTQPTDQIVKRPNVIGNIPMNDIFLESRFFASRSVPSTPVPYTKCALPNFNTSKTHVNENITYRGDDYCSSNTMTSKSVPSTPLISDSRNIFSYTNKDFLINGNSLEPGLGLINFTDKKVTKNNLEESLMEVTNNLMEDKTEAVLASLSSSPLPETIDMVNTGLVPFQEDMDITNELPTFTEQGISTENDLLGALDRIDTVSYDNL